MKILRFCEKPIRVKHSDKGPVFNLADVYAAEGMEVSENCVHYITEQELKDVFGRNLEQLLVSETITYAHDLCEKLSPKDETLFFRMMMFMLRIQMEAVNDELKTGRLDR